MSFEKFLIPNDLPRHLTRLNTKATRENWFKQFDLRAKDNLMRSIPVIPEVAVHPGEPKKTELHFPKQLLIASLLLILCGILTLINRNLVLTHLYVAVYLVIAKTGVSGQKSRFLSVLKTQFGVIAIGITLVTIALYFVILTNSQDLRGIAVALDVWFAIWVFLKKIKPWNEEKIEVATYNTQLEIRIGNFEYAYRTREAAIAAKAELLAEVEKLVVECLHYEDMVRYRRDLFDEVLLKAFAELGVSKEVQHEVLSDPDRKILEISSPMQSPNEEYPRPIVEFKHGVLPRDPKDAPILFNYLSRLYKCTLAIILPQGLGTYEAVVDSVNGNHKMLGSQITMWKSISRVNRENTLEDWKEDVIVLETYGGTKTLLLINGVSIKENQEVIPVADSADAKKIMDDDIGTDSGRLVNSFVFEIQQKMTEGSV
jgi:hypothetical protein